MKDRFLISVNEADIDPVKLRTVLDQVGVAPATISSPRALGVYTVTIDDDMLGVERLRRELQDRGVESFVRHERAVSDAALLAAPLLVMRVKGEHGYSGPRYGTRFDMDGACPDCGTGGRPIGDVVLKEGDVSKRPGMFQTLDGEYFVSDAVREHVEAAGLTGAEFHDAIGARTSERLKWSQVLAPYVLPPLDGERTGGLLREDPCPTCDRDRYFDTARAPLEPYYDMSLAELDRVPDFSSTWEHFGRSRLTEPFEASVFAQARLVVKPSVVELLKRLRVRDLVFDPARLAGGEPGDDVAG